MNNIFGQYIPKFEYELVNLNDYSQQDLVGFNNAISLLLIMDKVKVATDIKNLRKLPEQFIEEMAKKVPEPFLVIFKDCIELLLRKINVPKEEIEKITEKIHERRFNAMFDIIDGYDVQVTRRVAKEEEKIETAKKMLLRNKPMDEIVEFTGLTEEKIKEIEKTL